MGQTDHPGITAGYALGGVRQGVVKSQCLLSMRQSGGHLASMHQDAPERLVSLEKKRWVVFLFG